MRGVTVSDNNGTPTVTRSGALSSIVGEYEITYTATDEAGNTTSKKRKITVEEGGKTPTEILEKDQNIIEDLDGNLRYTGSNPDNWVCFGDSSITDGASCDNNHKWRIIGIIDGYMKIMMNYLYKDSSGSTGFRFNTSPGAFPWPNSTLNKELNGESFYSNNTYIDETYRGYLKKGTWYIGGGNISTFQDFVSNEKKASTTGYIGLVNVVDYGYAGSNCNVTTDMTSEGNVCMSNNWMKSPGWTITPGASQPYNYVIHSSNIYSVNIDGSEGRTDAVKPVAYLRPTVRIKSGTGTEEDPYILDKEKETIDDGAGRYGTIVLDTYGNERYAGSNPNNWVCFGDSSIIDPSNCDEYHKWRIIDDKMKIMTNYSYGLVSWEQTYSNNYWGTPVSLNTSLNGRNFYSNNYYIDGTHREYIANGIWNVGKPRSVSPLTLQAFIDGETTSNATSYIGLMSMVDYGYASSSCTPTTGMPITRGPCLSNNWIGYDKNKWTITTGESGEVWAIFIETVMSVKVSGKGTNNYTSDFHAHPALYLESGVRPIAGSGTEDDPYILSK